ncbi:hypothetical protein LIER_28062 [Lithospermum erythrorhizon]|uniref:Uncharacterized protein n=1 Tax=Lithospermum erythrorhizon TaxID=34254 RepID=A0AAV3RFZ8_LITER
MGIVINAEDSKTINTEFGQSTVQTFTFIDFEEHDNTPIKRKIDVILWGAMILAIGPTLVEAANTNAVVVAKRLKATRYKVVSLRSKNSSSFAVNPPIEAARNLKTWCDSMRETELTHMLQDVPIVNY